MSFYQHVLGFLPIRTPGSFDFHSACSYKETSRTPTTTSENRGHRMFSEILVGTFSERYEATIVSVSGSCRILDSMTQVYMTYLTWGLVNDTYRDGPHPLSLYTHFISSRSLAFTLLLFTKRKT
ncbi:hypothetical protein YC2023_020019 [Brassica napus]